MQIQWSRYVKWALFTASYWLGNEKPRLFSEAVAAVVTVPTVPHSSTLTLLVMLGFIQQAAASSKKEVDDGLIAYYPFTDGSTGDFSGNNHHGLPVGDVVGFVDINGHENQAMFFNGNAYIKGSSTGFPSTARTVSLWFYLMGGPNSNPVLFSYGGNPCGTSHLMSINNYDIPGTYEVQAHCRVDRLISRYPEFPNFNWHHWVVVSNNTSTKMYLDLNLVASSNIPLGPTNSFGREFALATGTSPTTGMAPYSDANVGYFTGILDELRIYDRPLTQEEIERLFFQFTPIPTSTASSSSSSSLTTTHSVSLEVIQPISLTSSPVGSQIVPGLSTVASNSNLTRLLFVILPVVIGGATLFALIFGVSKLYRKQRNKKSFVVVHPTDKENQRTDSLQLRNTSQAISSEMPSCLIGSNTASSSQEKPDDAAMLVESKLQIIPYARLGEKGRVLGEGGFGVVYQSTWQQAKVAVKELRVERLSDASLVEFQEEAKRHAALRHPNIVTLFGLCVEPGHYCLVMELMVMGSLYQVLHNRQSFPWGTRLNIAKEIAIGLAYLHEQSPPMLHRDLKSFNVLLDAGMHAKLADFGQSNVKNSAGRGLGTLQWMAPELFKEQCPTECSDIYALGMVFWELASRQKPFAEILNQFAIMEHVRFGKREEIPEDTPPPFAKLISRCWEERTLDRPSVSEVVKELVRSARDAESVSNVVSLGYQHFSHH